MSSIKTVFRRRTSFFKPTIHLLQGMDVWLKVVLLQDSHTLDLALETSLHFVQINYE